MDKIQCAYIFANGDPKSEDYLLDKLSDNDIVIAADGGVENLRKLGKLPHVVIGDLDSIQPTQINELKANNVQILSYPTRKDETDLELALMYAHNLGIKDIVILCALGARWDMTLANLLLPCATDFQNLNIRLVDAQYEITLLRSGMTLHIEGHAGDTISLIPVGYKAEGITSNGLEYQLYEDTLNLGSARGVSNVLVEDQATIHLKSGLLICIHIKQI